MAIPETKALKQYNLIGDSIYYHHFRTEAAGEEYLHPSEVHTAHELLLLLEGEISYMIEGEVYTAGPGDMIFVAPGEVHSIRIGGEKPYERLVLLFDIGVLERLMQELKVHLNAFAYDGENRLHILPRALVQRYGLDGLLFDILETEDEDRYKRILIMSKLLSFIIRMKIVLYFFFFFGSGPGIEPEPSAMGTQSLIHWTTRKPPSYTLLLLFTCIEHS